jgi:hypothetical protein
MLSFTLSGSADTLDVPGMSLLRTLRDEVSAPSPTEEESTWNQAPWT